MHFSRSFLLFFGIISCFTLQADVPFGYSQEAIEKYALQIPTIERNRKIKYIAAAGTVFASLALLLMSKSDYFNFDNENNEGFLITIGGRSLKGFFQPISEEMAASLSGQASAESSLNFLQHCFSLTKKTGSFVWSGTKYLSEALATGFLTNHVFSAMSYNSQQMTVLTYIDNYTNLKRCVHYSKVMVDGELQLKKIALYEAFEDLEKAADSLPFVRTKDQMQLKLDLIKDEMLMVVEELIKVMGYLEYRQQQVMKQAAYKALIMKTSFDVLNHAIEQFCIDIEKDIDSFVNDIENHELLCQKVGQYKDTLEAFVTSFDSALLHFNKVELQKI